MPEDVLEKLSSAIGRSVKPAKDPTIAAPTPTSDKDPNGQTSLEKAIGRKVAPTPFKDPLMHQRFKIYRDARTNGMEVDKSVATARSMAAVADAAKPKSTFGKVTDAIGDLPIGPGAKRTLGDVGHDIGSIAHRLWSNPLAMSDEEWEKNRQVQEKFFNDELKKTLDKQGEPKTGVDKFRAGAAKFEAGALGGLAETAESFTSPGQIALMIGTFGESALQRVAAKVMPAAVPAVKTLAKLMQLNFTASMIEGTASGIEGTVKNAMSGDWQAAGAAATEGLISGVMAKSAVNHEMATARVRGDLETTARKMYGVPEGSTLKGALTSRFDQLNPHDQGIVIDAAVKSSPEYQAVIADVDAKNEAAKAGIKKQQERKLNDYYGHTLSQAFDPNVAKRTMDGLQKATEINAGIEQEAQRKESIKDALAQRMVEYGETRRQAKEARIDRSQEFADRRKEGASDVGRMATSIAEGRNEVWKQRNASQEELVAQEVPRREVDSVLSEDGQVQYPAFYFGEENHFGVASDLAGHAVYRQTPRGVEWMDSSGNFSEDTASGYVSPDPATADTIARLTALGTLDNPDEATPEKIADADQIADIRRDLVSGEIDAKEAQRRAGISEKTTLPDEYTAARDGRLNGPFHESSASGYYEGLKAQAASVGMSEGETAQFLDEAGMLARQQTESNLNHVYRPGDYIVSKKGVKWRLDAKGMLHPDVDGNPIPLMKRGLYSNMAVQLAESGRVGYGTKTREELREDDRRRGNALVDIVDHQDQVDREMLLAVQREGLQTAPPEMPRADFGQKRERQERIMSRPPRAPESDVSKIVRMVFKAPTDAKSVIHAIANRQGISDEEVMRLQLAKDPERSTTTEAQIARLEVGDTISDDFRKDRPWKVEQGKDGSLYIRSGNASPLKLDRLNPSDRVRGLVEKGTITTERPEFTAKDVNRAAYETPHYVTHQENLTEKVQDIASGKAKEPEPRNEKQAEAQVVAAERREAAAEAVATRAVVDALEPSTDSVEKAEADAVKASEAVKVAEQAYSQSVEAIGKTIPADVFPQRAPATIGYRSAEPGVLMQNSREIPFHYELLPLEGLLSSHVWNGPLMVVNEEYPSELQPRTVSEGESKENGRRAERKRTTENGRTTGYNFQEYSDKTVGGTTGPAIVDQGGRVVGGNTRIAIMRRHLQNLESIPDVEERESMMLGWKAAIRRMAAESGIHSYPEDGGNYVVVRMMEEPIQTKRQAAELGRLFNKPVSVQIAKSARGVSYARSLDAPVLADIGRRVDGYDGLIPAMEADPEFFRDIVINRFGVDPQEYVDWFDDVEGRGLVLNDQGRSQFSKVLMGTVIKDTAILNRIEGKTPYRALERALGYMVKMQGLPERDIIGKITEAAQAAAETMGTDPGLSLSNDQWLATYHPDQAQLLGMETENPPEPDRMVETLWRALHASTAATPRTFSDRLKAFIGDESSSALQLFEERTKTPVEAFNDAFSKQLKEVAFSRKDSQEELTQEEYDAALKNRELSDVERLEAEKTSDSEGGRGKSPEQPDKGVEAAPPAAPKGMERPPAPPVKAPPAEKALAAAKAEAGYVTPAQLKSFLDTHPATKDHASELMRTARMMAEHVFEGDKPVGVDKKDALEWVLKQRLAGIEAGELKSKRGQYNDPNVDPEKNLGDRIMRLHKAADASTFIHEFAHVVFPMLSDEDLKDIDTGITGGGKGHVWDGQRGTLRGDVYRSLSEKFAHGIEQYLRDENPTGFSAEVKAVLAKVKEMMRGIYMKFKGDPLSEFQNSDESRDVFAKMFKVTENDIPDRWHEEVKKARAEEKRMKRPEDEPHPIQRQASDAGAVGIRNTFAGKVEDSVGTRVDPRKPTAVFVFPDANKANNYYATIASGGAKIDSAELIQAEDGSYGVRFNTKAKVPSNVLYQELAPKHISGQLEDAKKLLASTPASAPMLRKMREMLVRKLENEIRSQYGAETEPVEESPEIAKQVLQEVKNASGKNADRVRTDVDGVPKPADAQRTGGITKPPTLGRAGNGAAGPRVGADRKPVARPHVPASLEQVKPVALEPLRAERGQGVGTVVGEAFDGKAWVDGLKRAGLPENLPPPTWALDRKTAAQLIFPGQPQVAQTALSALEQGDGAVVASATGTGKTYTAAAIAKEWRSRNPDAKILFVTKNASLMKSAQDVAINTFGFEIGNELPDADAPAGNYGTTYARIIRSEAAKNTKWDLVIADESGEARRWYDEDNKQGKALKDIIANSGKALYFSATPFHSPMEYGYLDKLNMWPKGGFDKWIESNFAHEKKDGKVIAKLDPGKQAKLRQQLIERGQLVSQAISYDGFTAHFGVVPVTDQMKRGLDRIHEGFARAKQQLIQMKKKGLAEKIAAFEATYTKAFLERERLPQAIELAKKARAGGWQVAIFSETSSEDLFRRETGPDEERSTYQELDDAMGGQLSKIIPPFADVYDRLREEFGDNIGDYSGRGNSMAERDKAKADFLSGERPLLYTTYAAGGIGVSLHDADFPDRGIKGGDKPRVAIYLGPPYSGVLLEQAMGRFWRFGVKSDTHAVFLATDSEPDVRLMQQKVGPRMRSLRAAVLGERDSLASAMSTYTDEEKVRSRQEALAYSEGNEVQVNATDYQVRSKSRNVGVNDWSQINFPPAETAKNKGMKYGQDVTGGDWSTLYQEKFGFMQQPPSPADMAGMGVIDAIGNGIVAGDGLPPGVSVQNMDPSDRDVVLGMSSASASAAVDVPVERDKTAVARQAMQARLNMPGDKNKWMQVFEGRRGKKSKWIYDGPPEDIAPTSREGESTAPKNIKTFYAGPVFSQEIGIRGIARWAKVPEVGEEINRMNRAYQRDNDFARNDFLLRLHDIIDSTKAKVKDPRVMDEIWDVKRGRRTSEDEAVNKTADKLVGWFDHIRDAMATANVKLKTPSGEMLPWQEISKDPSYMPNYIDWEASVVEPKTGDTYKLKDLMGNKLPEDKHRRIVEAIAKEKNTTYDRVMEYLKGYGNKDPLASHVQRARVMDFPIIKKDFNSLIAYASEAARTIAIEQNFGHDRKKLDAEIAKIPSANGRKTIDGMFNGLLQPEEWSDITAKIYNAAVTAEVATKMIPFSISKVPFHIATVPIGLKGRLRAPIRAAMNLIFDHKDVMENAIRVGSIVRQLNDADIIAAPDSQGITHGVFKFIGFNWEYKMVRAFAGESARVHMEQYVMNDLRKGGTKAEEARRLVRNVFLIGDKGIDEALQRGQWSPEDLAKAQIAFTNLTTWSNNPLQMPGWARLHIERDESSSTTTLKRAVRLTYALQSFSAKHFSFLREHMWDEVMNHKNLKPLAYMLVAYPVLGQLLGGAGAGAHNIVHRSMQGLTGQPKTDKDKWDTWLAEQEAVFHDPVSIKALRWYIDGLTLTAAMDRTRRYGDFLADIAEGGKKAASGKLTYMLENEAEEMIGPAYSEAVELLKHTIIDWKIDLGSGSDADKKAKLEKERYRYMDEVLPATKQIPGMTAPPKPVGSTRKH